MTGCENHEMTIGHKKTDNVSSDWHHEYDILVNKDVDGALVLLAVFSQPITANQITFTGHVSIVQKSRHQE